MNPLRQPGEDDVPVVDLSDFDDAFAKAEEPKPLAPIPDGTYRVRIEHLEITAAKTSGRPLLKWKLRVLGPTYAGRVLWRNHVFSSPEHLRWLKQDLRTCGIQLDRLSELPLFLEQLLDLELLAVHRTTAGGSSVLLRHRVDATDRPARSKAPF